MLSGHGSPYLTSLEKKIFDVFSVTSLHNLYGLASEHKAGKDWTLSRGLNMAERVRLADVSCPVNT